MAQTCCPSHSLPWIGAQGYPGHLPTWCAAALLPAGQQKHACRARAPLRSQRRLIVVSSPQLLAVYSKDWATLELFICSRFTRRTSSLLRGQAICFGTPRLRWRLEKVSYGFHLLGHALVIAGPRPGVVRLLNTFFIGKEGHWSRGPDDCLLISDSRQPPIASYI